MDPITRGRSLNRTSPPAGANLPDSKGNETTKSENQTRYDRRTGEPIPNPLPMKFRSTPPDAPVAQVVEATAKALGRLAKLTGKDAESNFQVVSTQEVTISATRATISHQLASGLILERQYNPSLGTSVDAQCGSLSYWIALVNAQKSNVSYYNYPSSAWNKFHEKLKLVVYQKDMAFPSFVPSTAAAATYRRDGVGTTHSNILTKYYPDTVSREKIFAHEVGHAHHNWADVLGQTNNAGKAVFEKWFSLQSTNPPVAFNQSSPSSPWSLGQNPEEIYSDAFRYWMGTPSSQVSETLPAGFKNPSTMPQLKKQFNILPETAAYWKSYGVTADTLSWQGDATSGYFQFKNSSGTWMAQTAPYEWYYWTPPQNGQPEYWTRTYPTYTLQ